MFNELYLRWWPESRRGVTCATCPTVAPVFPCDRGQECNILQGKHPADLRNMVTSPGGTTTEALLQLKKGGFRSLILKAVAAAYKKAECL